MEASSYIEQSAWHQSEWFLKGGGTGGDYDVDPGV